MNQQITIGSRVRGWDNGSDHKGGTPLTGVVIAINRASDPRGATLRLRLDDTDLRHKYGDWSIWADTAELMAEPLDITKPVRCRGGAKCELVRKVEDKTRPYRALVTLPMATALELSFNQYGQFYEGFETPMDLVQA